MRDKSLLTIAIIAGGLALVGGLALYAQEKYSAKVPGGLAMSEFRGYEAWQTISVSRNERVVAVILGNPAMIEAYLEKLAERRGEITAQVIAARPLSETQLTLLSDQLRRSVGRRVSVDTRVDPGLIGGMVVKVGSRMVDGSVKSKLQRLQLAMKGIG